MQRRCDKQFLKFTCHDNFLHDPFSASPSRSSIRISSPTANRDNNVGLCSKLVGAQFPPIFRTRGACKRRCLRLASGKRVHLVECLRRKERPGSVPRITNHLDRRSISFSIRLQRFAFVAHRPFESLHLAGHKRIGSLPVAPCLATATPAISLSLSLSLSLSRWIDCVVQRHIESRIKVYEHKSMQKYTKHCLFVYLSFLSSVEIFAFRFHVVSSRYIRKEFSIDKDRNFIIDG